MEHRSENIFSAVGQWTIFALLILILVSGPTLAAERNLGWNEAVDHAMGRVCQKFQQVTPPPPPIQRLLVGTLDSNTGVFTWAPNVFTRPTGQTIPTNPALQPVFTGRGIRPLVVNLDPIVLRLPLPQGIISSQLPGALQSGSVPAGAVMPRGVPTPKVAPSHPSAAVLVPKIPPPLQGHSTLFFSFYVPVTSGSLDLVFQVINQPPGTPFAVTVEGRTAQADASQPNLVDIVIPARTKIAFSLASGAKVFQDTIHFARPPMLGCLTLQAFPVTMVYAPPGSDSYQEQTAIKQLGTQVRSISGRSSSETRPVDTPFSTVGDMISLLGTVGKIVAIAYPNVGKGMQEASEVLNGLWGSSHTDQKVSHSVTQEHTLNFQYIQSSSVKTSLPSAGPGKGDAIYFLTKPTFAWLVVQDDTTDQVFITVSLLGFEGVGLGSADNLRNPTTSPPPPDVQKLLVTADPLAPEYVSGGSVPVSSSTASNLGPFSSLPSVGGRIGTSACQPGMPSWPRCYWKGRLVPAEPFSFDYLGGAQWSQSLTRAIEQVDVTTESSILVTTTKEESGFLSYIAKNVPHEGETSFQTWQTSSSELRVGNSVTDTVTLSSPTSLGELNFYYDVLYGTFAVVPAGSGPVLMSGQVSSSSTAFAGREVRLVANGLVFVARTDPQGRYAFRSRSITPGNHLLIVGNKRIPFRFEGPPISNLNIAVD